MRVPFTFVYTCGLECVLTSVVGVVSPVRSRVSDYFPVWFAGSGFATDSESVFFWSFGIRTSSGKCSFFTLRSWSEIPKVLRSRSTFRCPVSLLRTDPFDWVSSFFA